MSVTLVITQRSMHSLKGQITLAIALVCDGLGVSAMNKTGREKPFYIILHEP